MIMAPMASEGQLEELRRALGYGDPVLVQFVNWISEALRGQFGYSYFIQTTTTEALARALPYTATLIIAAMSLALLLCLPIGVLAAVYRDSLFDRAVLGFAVFFQSVPNFWMGLMLLFVVSVRLKLLPAVGYRGPAYAVLPIVTLSTSAYTALIRNVRLTMINALESNYVMAARARGIPFWSVLLKHAFRNGWVSLITLLGAQLGYMLGGAIVVEYVYNYPGIGLLTLLSVLRRDYPVIQALSLILSTSFVLLNLIVDVSYGFIDPRIRRAQEAE